MNVTNASAVIVAPEVTNIMPFGFNLLMFLILFAVTIAVSTLILWQAMRLLHGKQHKLKTAFLAALIANSINSILFTGMAMALGALGTQALFASKLFAVAMAVLNWLIIITVSLIVTKKLYRLPIKKLAYPVIIWTIGSMLFGALFMPSIAGIAGQALSSAYPLPPRFINITLPGLNDTAAIAPLAQPAVHIPLPPINGT